MLPPIPLKKRDYRILHPHPRALAKKMLTQHFFFLEERYELVLFWQMHFLCMVFTFIWPFFTWRIRIYAFVSIASRLNAGLCSPAAFEKSIHVAMTVACTRTHHAPTLLSLSDRKRCIWISVRGYYDKYARAEILATIICKWYRCKKLQKKAIHAYCVFRCMWMPFCAYTHAHAYLYPWLHYMRMCHVWLPNAFAQDGIDSWCIYSSHSRSHCLCMQIHKYIYIYIYIYIYTHTQI